MIDERSNHYLDEECEEILRAIALSLKISITSVREVVRHQFRFVTESMTKMELKSIRLKYFGTFHLNRRGWYKWYLRECEREEREKREVERNNERMEKRYMEESKDRTNGESESVDMRPLSEELV